MCYQLGNVGDQRHHQLLQPNLPRLDEAAHHSLQRVDQVDEGSQECCSYVKSGRIIAVENTNDNEPKYEEWRGKLED